MGRSVKTLRTCSRLGSSKMRFLFLFFLSFAFASEEKTIKEIQEDMNYIEDLLKGHKKSLEIEKGTIEVIENEYKMMKAKLNGLLCRKIWEDK